MQDSMKDENRRQPKRSLKAVPLSFSPLQLTFIVAAFALPVGVMLLKPDLVFNSVERWTTFIDRARKRRPNKQLQRLVHEAIDPVVSNPGAISVFAKEGVVTLKGPILKAELRAVLTAVHGLVEVREVRDELEVHESSTGVPGLQGRREWHLPDPDEAH